MIKVSMAVDYPYAFAEFGKIDDPGVWWFYNKHHGDGVKASTFLVKMVEDRSGV